MTVMYLFVHFCQAQFVSPEEYPEKVKSLDSTLETLYAVISGEKGEKRDWGLFRYLFVPEARLIPTRTTQDSSSLIFMTTEDYIQKAGAYLEENGFFEKEISREVDTFGSMTQVFSTYESYYSKSDSKPFSRGINSIQLMNDGSRWWVVNIYWVAEQGQNLIPAMYLPGK